MSDSFVHLHTHTRFSVLDGAAKLEPLVKKASDDGQPALAVTDHGNMFAWVDFYNLCAAYGIKAIPGNEQYQAFETRFERLQRKGKGGDDSGGVSLDGRKQYYHLITLAETQTGYENLMKLSSEAYTSGYYVKPRTDWDLLDKYHEGIIATSGCLGGQVLQELLRGDNQAALDKAGLLQDIFGKDNFFIELQRHGIEEQDRTNPQLLQISQILGAPVIATQDSHYTNREDHDAHDALLCCQTGTVMSDPDRFKFTGDQHYLKTAAEMRELFRDIPEACDNTLLIAERVNVGMDFSQQHLPHFPVPKGFADDNEYLYHLMMQGAVERWDMTDAIIDRLQYEFDVIANMGYSSYFLVLWDIVQEAKRVGIRTGPGRGSAAGCALSYALEITNLDPIKYDLIFERFLNPERAAMPDIDLDIEPRGREYLIKYCTEKYGRDFVAQIVTFTNIGSRKAVRSAARVLSYDFNMGSKIATTLPPLRQGRSAPLQASVELTKGYEEDYARSLDLRKILDYDTDARKIFDVANGLEGLIESESIHAAAVVISDAPITTYSPVFTKPGVNDNPADVPVATMYDMHGVEALGLLKMDFLGLRNLEIISDTLSLLENEGLVLDIDTIPLDDTKTFEMLQKGEGVGVFQLESSGMRDLMVRLKPDCFEDIAALVALYRPGPMAGNMHYDYADRKNGRQQSVPFHPDAADILKDTYGIMVYQEQIQQVAQLFAGYPLGDGYLLIKIIGKKRMDKMVAERDKFVQGCIDNGYDEATGSAIFTLIEPAADYSFNKSHAFSYGMVSYQTAYLKANYPLQYFAATLNSVEKQEKITRYINEAGKRNVTVTVPDINKSSVTFAPAEGEIPYALSAILNVGDVAMADIAQARPYKDFFDYSERAPQAALNKRAVEFLIKAGAFDSMGHSRKGLLDVYDQILEDASKRRKKEAEGQFSMFEEKVRTVHIPEHEFDRETLMRLEKESTGVYISDHPLLGREKALEQQTTMTVAEYVEERPDTVQTLGGLISSLELKRTKKGDSMAVFQLEDLDDSIEVVVFPKQFKKLSSNIKESNIVIIEGRLNDREETKTTFIADKMTIIGEERMYGTKPLHVMLKTADVNALLEMKKLFEMNPGNHSVFVHVEGKTMQLPMNVDADKVRDELIDILM